MSYLLDKRNAMGGQKLTGAGGQTKTVQPVQKQTTAAPVQTQATPAVPAQTQSAAQPAEKQQTAQTPAQTQGTGATAAQPQTTSAADQAQQLLSQQQGYVSNWGNSIQDVLNRLLNPEEFAYDVNSDPLYLQLRDQYMRDGKLAMEDTMGQAAQLTGGYGNSYAQMAGQQTYNGYLKGINDMVPELREAARADYDAEQNQLLQQLSLLMDQDSQDYSRYLDELERQRYDEEWAYQQGRDALSDQRYDDELAYGREQDSYNRQQDAYDRLVEMITATGYTPTAEELAAAGMTEDQARAWRSYYDATYGGSGSGGSSSGGGGGNQTPRSPTPVDDTPIEQNPDGSNILTREELGDPFQKEDYTTVYGNCLVFAGNGASASEVAAYIKEALSDGSITQAQYNELMARFGNLIDTGNNNSSSSSGSSSSNRGGGPGVSNRYNTFN